MKEILAILKKQSKLIMLIAFFCTAAFDIIGRAGNFGNGFMPVIGDLLSMVIELCLLLVVPLLIILNKEKCAKLAFSFLFPYWLITSIFNFLSSTDRMVKGVNGIWISASVFEFIIALAFLAVAGMLLFDIIKKEKKFTTVATLILLGSLLFHLLSWALRIAAYAKGNWGWPSYIYCFEDYIFHPVAMIFGLIFFLDTPCCKKCCCAKAEEASAEEKPEEQKEEPVAAEKPVEDVVEKEPEATAPVEEETTPVEETNVPAEGSCRRTGGNR